MGAKIEPGRGAFDPVVNPRNRPLKFSDPDTLEACIEAYFAKQDRLGRPYTIAGLTLSLGFASRQSLADYEKRIGPAEFTYIIKAARTRIEEEREERLSNQPATTGVIFAMKNGHGWRDQIDVTGNDGVPLAPPALNITLVDKREE